MFQRRLRVSAASQQIDERQNLRSAHQKLGILHLTSHDNSRVRFENLFQKNMVLFGAGITGVEIFKVFSNYFDGIKISCFCDSFKTGFLCDLPIVSPDELREIVSGSSSHVVVISALEKNRSDMLNTLAQLGISEEKIYTLPEIDNLTVAYLSDPRIDDWYGGIKVRKHGLMLGDDRDIYLDWWCPEHYCSGDVLVYQPGKVGSSTVCNSLSKAGVQVTHVHMLTDSFIFDLIPELAWTPDAKQAATVRECADLCIGKMRKTTPQKIVTLVREPIGRDYSQFFYHMSLLQKAGYLTSDASVAEACVSGIERRATQNGKLRHGYQFEWFDKELKAVFGVDVLDHPFDKEAGYAIVRHGNVEVLLIKLEMLDRLQKVIGKFVGLADFELENANEARTKSYRRLYRATQRDLRIPEHIFSMYYDNNPHMDHFYSDDEKAAFRLRWAGHV